MNKTIKQGGKGKVGIGIQISVFLKSAEISCHFKSSISVCVTYFQVVRTLGDVTMNLKIPISLKVKLG